MVENRGALKGLRVIEMGQLLAGPFCGQLLGDMGAEIIKIEPPGAGDPMRVWGQGSDKVNWEVIARNKKSVSANLRVAEGQALVRRLIATADILVGNALPIRNIPAGTTIHAVELRPGKGAQAGKACGPLAPTFQPPTGPSAATVASWTP